MDGRGFVQGKQSVCIEEDKNTLEGDLDEEYDG
jgi:hypothetical protein